MGKYMNVTTILQGLYFFIYLIKVSLYDTEGLHPSGNPITAAAYRKAIKDTHCIQFIFANEHNFKQNYATFNQNVTS